MNTERIFKNLILVEFFSCVAAVIWVLVEGAINPNTEESIVAEEFSANGVEFIMMAVVIVYIVNLYFLYKLKPIGKNIYVPLIVFMYGLYFGLPEEFIAHESVTEYVLNDVGVMIEGAIIAMLYWTDIKKKFEG